MRFSWQDSMRGLLTYLIVLLLALPSWGRNLLAASITVTASAECGVTISDPLSEGDTERLKAALEEAERRVANDPGRSISTRVICLNSNGGSLKEALRVVAFLMEDNTLATYIPQDAVCIEACAFVFMAGRETFENLTFPRRSMHVTAQVAFRAPPPDLDNAANGNLAISYKEAVQTLGVLAKHNGNHSVGIWRDGALPYPRSFIAAFIKAGSRNAVPIATLADLHRWSIGLKGGKRFSEVSRSGLLRACILYFVTREPVSGLDVLAPPDATVNVPIGRVVRTEFANFGTKGRVCFADAYKDRTGQIHLSISFGATARDKAVMPLDHLPKLLSDSPDSEPDPPIWTVLPLETPIAELR